MDARDVPRRGAPGATTQPTRHAIMRCSNDGAPTVTVRSRMPGQRRGLPDGRGRRRGRPRSRPSRAATGRARGRATRSPSSSSSLATQPDGKEALLRKTTRVRSVTAAGSAPRSSRHSPSRDVQRHEAGDGADEAHPVEHAGVGRVGEHDLVAGVGEAEERVEHRVALAGGDHDLPRVVARAAAALDRRRDRLLQVVPAREGQPAVRVVGADRLAGRLQRGGGRRDVRVEVLEPQHLRVVAGRGGDPVDAEAGDVLEPADAHGLVSRR